MSKSIEKVVLLLCDENGVIALIEHGDGRAIIGDR